MLLYHGISSHNATERRYHDVINGGNYNVILLLFCYKGKVKHIE